MANFLPYRINNTRFFFSIYQLYIIEMGGCYSTMLELPELLVFPIPSLIDKYRYLNNT